MVNNNTNTPANSSDEDIPRGRRRTGGLFGSRRAKPAQGVKAAPAIAAEIIEAPLEIDDAAKENILVEHPEAPEVAPVTDPPAIEVDVTLEQSTVEYSELFETSEEDGVEIVDPFGDTASLARIDVQDLALEPATSKSIKSAQKIKAEEIFPVALTNITTTSLVFHSPPRLPGSISFDRFGKERRPNIDRNGNERGLVANERNARFGQDRIGQLPLGQNNSENVSDQPRTAKGVPETDEGTTRRRTRDRSNRPTAESRETEFVPEPQRVKGSTRLEAKKQRRRDGRDAGRRRNVVSEAEFLARREAVERRMVVREFDGRTQIGVLEDGVLVEHYVARKQDASLIGNVYLGKVQNVLPSMEAAFVDIGRGRNAVLYSGEVDWDAAAEAGEKNQPRKIEIALKPGDTVLVQVTKDPVGHKGARLTSQISLPGRYLVYVPSGNISGISRKLPDTERVRLKKILKEITPNIDGMIVRTAAEGATEEQLGFDVERLVVQWEEISAQLEKSVAPALLHSEPDLLVKIVRDVFNEDFQQMVIDGSGAHETITRYLGSVAPELIERIETYSGSGDSFVEYRIKDQIDKALERKVYLPSGGSLVIDRTEAMTVIDVNTGKFVGAGGNLEETVTKNNLEAAEEVVRQLRLRDIGGIIVVDFIDMVLESNRDLVLRRLVECFSRDRTKHQVAEVTSLGLVQMTRKKLGLGLVESFSENCEVCAGRGIVIHHEPVFKHSNASAPEKSGRRSARSAQPTGDTVTPHAITADVKNALAQIAASTISGGPSVVSGSNSVSVSDAAVEADVAGQSGNTVGEGGSNDEGNAKSGEHGGARKRGRRSRGGKGNSGNGSGSGEVESNPKVKSSSVAKDDTAVKIVNSEPPTSRQPNVSEESVVAQPRKSRRVSTGALSSGDPVELND